MGKKKNITPELIGVFQSALEAARRAFVTLGDDGRWSAEDTNRFGERPLLAEVACEKAVIGEARKAAWPVRVLSEECGLRDLVPEPSQLLVLDSLDGSGAFSRGESIPQFGTMLALFRGTNPRFADWLLSGVVLQQTGRWLLAVNHSAHAGVLGSSQGAGKSPADLNSVSSEMLTGHSLLYADNSFPTVAQVFSRPLVEAGYQTRYFGASAGYYADLVRGRAVAVLECTRKDSLEILVAYGLIKKAGGVMIDALSGDDLAEQLVLDYGARPDSPVISANTRANAEEIRRICHLADEA